MSVVQLEISRPYQAPEPAGDSVESFELILDHYERRILQIPDHQRMPDAWDRDKRLEYIERLRESSEGSHPPGSFATYQIVSSSKSASATFLNDGYQRLTTLAELKRDPSLYAMDEDSVRQLLSQRISKQHRHYLNHEQAMRDFQLINAGTHLSPLELCHGYLVYMPDYQNAWKPLFDHIHGALSEADARLRASRGYVRRDQEHKRRRDTYALFHRFLTEEKRAIPYIDVGRKEVRHLISTKAVVELKLRSALEVSGLEQATKSVKRFTVFIESETALLDVLRGEVLGAGIGLQPVLWRWLLHFAVWRRNNRVPVELQRRFIEAALSSTGGKGQWVGERKEGVVLTFSLSHLGLLQKAAELADMPELVQAARRRRSSPKQALRPGLHNSHIKPFSTHGDGAVFPEPASLNLARGAKEVDLA